jgi:hypothetical protein
MLLQMLDQVVLGICRSRDEHRACVAEAFRNRSVKPLVLPGVATANRVGLMVDVARLPIWSDNCHLGCICVERTDPRRMMIDPDDRVKVFGHDGAFASKP